MRDLKSAGEVASNEFLDFRVTAELALSLRLKAAS